MAPILLGTDIGSLERLLEAPKGRKAVSQRVLTAQVMGMPEALFTTLPFDLLGPHGHMPKTPFD